MPGVSWNLAIEGEAAYLIPYLDSTRPHDEEVRVLTWLAVLTEDPHRPFSEYPPDSGVYSAIIPGTTVCAIWSLDHGARTIALAHLAPE